MSYEMMEIIEQTSSSIFPFNPFFFPTDAALTSDVTDLLLRQTTPFSSESRLTAISDRVRSLESLFDRLLSLKEREKSRRKYTWTAEVKGKEVGERKYKWSAEIDSDDDVKKYQWRTEIKKKDDDVKRTYTWQATIGGDKKEEKNKKEKSKEEKNSEKGACVPRIVEIDEPTTDYRSLILRQAYTKRVGRDKGKTKELSPQDAAAFIQTTFKTHLIRRSQTLRALRELAVAKTKLKELRSSFHDFSFRSRLSRHDEERQKFSEKIIVLLLTVDAIEGVDMMVRSAKRSMVDELEAMLDVVDPQPPGKTLSMRRRTFDVPSGVIQKEIAEEVAHVVHLLDEENTPF